MRIEAYGRTRSAWRPPSNRLTGWPVAWPNRSHRAMSMALMAWVSVPPRPSQNEF